MTTVGDMKKWLTEHDDNDIVHLTMCAIPIPGPEGSPVWPCIATVGREEFNRLSGCPIEASPPFVRIRG